MAKILVTHHALHRFFERMLKQSIVHGEFVHKFQTDRDFREKLIAQFENFFFQNLEDATIYRKPDGTVVIMGGARIILEKPIFSEREQFSYVLKTVDFSWLELPDGRMGKEMRKGEFMRGRLTFLYPSAEKEI